MTHITSSENLKRNLRKKKMIPHDFEDNRPPQKPEGTRLTFMDYIMIGLTTFGVYTSFAVSSFLNLILVVFAWRTYERYRKGDYDYD